MNDENAPSSGQAGARRRVLASPCGRSFASSLPAEALAAIQSGVMRSRYRGRSFLKSPFDVALYLQLLERMRPRTVIEIGSKEGGSALWFADMLSTRNVEARVLTIDLQPPRDLDDPRITALACDAASLGDVLTKELLGKLPRPWLVTEDSAHTFEVCLAVLDFFDGHLSGGDYIVIEDGIVADMPGPAYEAFEDGPNRAVAAFLDRRRDTYRIDASLCDHFGHNVTYNPNGWLERL